jgi:hypothetical protein
MTTEQLQTDFKARVLKPLSGLHIEGRRWFQRGPGNTYNSVRIFANNERIAHLPFQYGYGDHFLDIALDWLEENGYIQREEYSNHSKAYGTRFLREGLGGTYSVTDVQRKKDL